MWPQDTLGVPHQLVGRRHCMSCNEGDVRWLPGLPGPPASPQAGFLARLPPPECRGESTVASPHAGAEGQSPVWARARVRQASPQSSRKEDTVKILAQGAGCSSATEGLHQVLNRQNT